MISSKKITAAECITKPMYLKNCKNNKTRAIVMYITFILFALGASGVATLLLNLLFEPATDIILKYSIITLNIFDFGINISNYSSSSGIPIIDVYIGFLDTFFIPVYLGLMLHNLIFFFCVIESCLKEMLNIINFVPIPKMISIYDSEDSGAI